MDTAIEKPKALIKNSILLALDIMAIVSGLIVLLNSIISMTELFSVISSCLAISCILFDIVFAYAFFWFIFKRDSEIPWFIGISSIVPLLLFSGRYLAFWFGFDKGVFLYDKVEWFSIVAAFRLIRMASNFYADSVYNLIAQKIKRIKILFLFGMLAILVVSFISDYYLIPKIKIPYQYRFSRLLEAIAICASLVFVVIYSSVKKTDNPNNFSDKNKNAYGKIRPRAEPAGSDELEGILGKKKRW